jgi:hypothetical protein
VRHAEGGARPKLQAVNDLVTWWHNGKPAGTESILVRTSGGYCWAAPANGNGIDLEAMVWAKVDAGGDWPLDEPLLRSGRPHVTQGVPVFVRASCLRVAPAATTRGGSLIARAYGTLKRAATG